MVYCTIEDMGKLIVSNKLAQLSNEETPTITNQEYVESLITDMSADIDNYLRSSYPLPLTSAPPILKRICKVLVKIQLYRGKPKAADQEELRKEEESVRRELVDIQKGIIKLDIAGFVPETPKLGRYAGTTRTQVFTDTLLSTMI